MTAAEAWAWPLVVLGGLGCLAWCGIHGLGALALARVPRLARADHDGGSSPDTVSAWPTLSAVVPVRNEARELAATVRSLLASGYPGTLEVLVVDDRSRDDTGSVADALARYDERVRVLHVQELPPGWLGKVHALQRGVDAARHELLLFTDAGVRFAPGALEQGVGHARRRRLDHLTLLPRLAARGLLQATVHQAFFVGYVRRSLGSARPEHDARPYGFGAFNLLSRSALTHSDGLAWLRMDVLDDLALGALMKRSGARSGFAVADTLIVSHWYADARATLRGFEKNAFGGLLGYSPGRLLGAVPTLVLLAIAPLLPLLASGVPWAGALSAAAVTALLLESLVARVRFGLPLLPSLAAPSSHPFMALALVRGAVSSLRRGGVEWSGTLYPLDEVRRGRRVTFP